MRAWICDNPTGTDAITWKEIPTPEPGEGEVLVSIKAASLNFLDFLIIQNKYQIKPQLPFVPGAEFAGVVEAVGKKVISLKAGDLVAGFTGTGAFGTHVVAPAERLGHLIPDFSFEDAAAFPCTYGTSYHALIDRAAVKAGETVLVMGASGGVGSAAVQVAKAAGATVIAAASSDDKCAVCRQIGADFTINYTSANIRNELKTLTSGNGPDIIFDPVGGELTEAVFRSLAWKGRYLVIGFAQGKIPSLPLNLALLKDASIMGVFWGEFSKREPQSDGDNFKKLTALYKAGKIKPLIEHKLPMQELQKAFALITARQVRGKIVLVND
ncbi:MAG: Alcohol dehydrogenase [Smithella sp. PtaU1.Bin162]|nr:MAG: Alcohol dehydrogenase [Smithella sp. PtaU1.Bin162]